MTFEQSMKRLEEIISTLEKNEQSLDETIKLFEEGMKLSRLCNEQLKAFEVKIEEIVNE